MYCHLGEMHAKGGPKNYEGMSLFLSLYTHSPTQHYLFIHIKRILNLIVNDYNKYLMNKCHYAHLYTVHKIQKCVLSLFNNFSFQLYVVIFTSTDPHFWRWKEAPYSLLHTYAFSTFDQYTICLRIFQTMFKVWRCKFIHSTKFRYSYWENTEQYYMSFYSCGGECIWRCSLVHFLDPKN